MGMKHAKIITRGCNTISTPNGRRENVAMVTLEDLQADFAGEAKRLGLKTEQDVVDMVKEVRRELWEERCAGED